MMHLFARTGSTSAYLPISYLKYAISRICEPVSRAEVTAYMFILLYNKHKS